jgi:threonine dehydratase
MDSLQESGFECLDLSDNELAKVHVRHLAGDRANVQHEWLFRFDFPESPGALQKFLWSLDFHWSLSLLHY